MASCLFPRPLGKKKRQVKNRLLNKEFLISLSKVLKKDAFFWFKTDHKPYFDQVVEAAEALSLSLEPKPRAFLLKSTPRDSKHTFVSKAYQPTKSVGKTHNIAHTPWACEKVKLAELRNNFCNFTLLKDSQRCRLQSLFSDRNKV